MYTQYFLGLIHNLDKLVSIVPVEKDAPLPLNKGLTVITLPAISLISTS